MVDALHMFMTAYGWTLREVMDLTLPQFRLLFAAMKKNPPINLIVPALLRNLQGEAEGGQLERSGVPVEKAPPAAGSDFLRRLGVAEAHG